MCEPAIPREFQNEVRAFNQERRRQIALLRRSKVSDELTRDILKAFDQMRMDVHSQVADYKRGACDKASVHQRVAAYTATMRSWKN